MKATKIFFAVFAAALLVGCNNELNLVGSYDDFGIKQSSVSDNKNMQLLWKHDELCVKISGEYMVENKATYNNPPLMYPADYLITFNSYTDANIGTNGFVPNVQVIKDGETVFKGADCPEANPQGICHREIHLQSTRYIDLTFYIQLLKGNNMLLNPFEGFCTLKLTNIKVYLLE